MQTIERKKVGNPNFGNDVAYSVPGANSEEVAKRVGFDSESTARRAEQVVNHGAPELVEAMGRPTTVTRLEQRRIECPLCQLAERVIFAARLAPLKPALGEALARTRAAVGGRGDDQRTSLMSFSSRPLPLNRFFDDCLKCYLPVKRGGDIWHYQSRQSSQSNGGLLPK